MNKAYLIIITLLLALIQSCTPAQTPASVDEPLADDHEGWSIPSPTKNTAVIHGELRSSTDVTVGDMVFLGLNITYENPELPPTVSFSAQNSPRASVDTDRGLFYFDNVEPAQNYVVMVMSGPGEFVYVTEENGNVPKMISVDGGDSVDLGILLIAMP